MKDNNRLNVFHTYVRQLLVVFIIFLFSGCKTVMDYHLDECDLSTNQTIKDYSDTKNDATAKHGTSNTDGKFSQTCQNPGAVICGNLEFKGEGYSVSQSPWYYGAQYYIEAPSTNKISPLVSKKAMTISGWFKTTNDGTIISKHNEYRVFIEGGTLKVTIWDKNGSPQTTNIKTSVTDGTWNFYAVTAKTSSRRGNKTLEIKVYYGDGESNTLNEVSKNFSGFAGVKNTTNNFFIGAIQWSSNQNPTDYFNGSIDEIGMVDEVQSKNNITKVYKNQKNHKNADGSDRTCPCTCAPSGPIANYQMDECSWDGTAGEVKDSSGNDYNGTAKKGANTDTNSSTGGGIYNVGAFVASKKQYIELENFPKLKDSRTITAWIKVNNLSIGGRIFADDKSNQSGDYALSYGDPGSGKIRFYIRGLSPISLDSSKTIEANKWYFIVATFDTSAMQKKLYIYDSNGSLLNSVSQNVSGSLQYSGGNASIGGELESGSEAQKSKFDGNIDEVKIFDKALIDDQITSVYDNDKDGKDSDGTPRVAPCCCFSSSNNLIANPSFETVCESQITQTWNNVAGGTVNMRKNLCGWNLADNSRGLETWEKTTEKPASDRDIFVEIDGYNDVVDNIWQLIDAQDREDYTIKFDYRKRDGSHKDDILAKWNDVEILNITDANNSTDKWQTATIYVKGTANKDKLSFEEPSSANDGYGSWIDNIRVVQGGPPIETVNYKFDAWDIFRDINDRNISTKIATESFNLSINALDENSTNYQEFNGTVCSCIDSANCFKNLFTDNNSSDQTTQGNPSFTIGRATPNVKVDIHWQKNVDTTCPLNSEDNTTLSTDEFAIRPNSFSFTLPEQAYAGENFLIDFNASSISDYNETKDGSFIIESNITKAGCNVGTLNIDNFSFIDGKKESVDANYTNIGDLNITIKEKLSSEYAIVDADDSNDTVRLIEEFSHVIYIKPYELNVTAVEMNASTVTNWLYMANVNDMNLTLFATVQANNKQHQKLDDFNASCYAKDVNLTFALDVLDGDGVTDMNYTIIDGTFTNTGSTLADINKTININANSFIAGEGNASYALNVDRNFSAPINPFTIEDLNVSVATTDISKEVHNKENGSSFIFYYARVRANDVITQKTSVPHFAEVEVYDASGSSYVDGFKQNSLKWYRNENHNSPLSDIIEINGTKSSTLNNTTIHISPSSTTNGKIDFDINNSTTGNYYMHIKTNDWLWYIPSSYGDDYNDTLGSNCTTHPCFNYTLTNNSSTHTIQSGDFNGSDYSVPSRGEYKKTGIKVYR